MSFRSKLPNTGTTIFSLMSALAAQHGAINLSQGFPNYDPPERLRELVAHHLQAGHNQYAPMAGLPTLRSVLARRHSSSTASPIDPAEEITITSGATEALFAAISCLIQPGDEVVLFEPAYDSYRPVVELCGGVVKACQLYAPTYRVDWDAFRTQLSARTRLVVINTPHNPTGTIWSKSDWEQLQAILAEYDTYVLSDEVYEQLVYDGQRHYSLLDFPELFRRGFATFSFGKTFHSTGWKVGYCLAPAELMREFRKVHQYTVFSVNTPVQYALADYLQDPDSYTGLSAFYQEKRDQLRTELATTPLRTLDCQGTYFQLCDYSAVSDENDVDFARRLTTEVGVAAIPVSAFRSVANEERTIRLCFAKTPDVLAAAGETLRRAW
ncbi:MAG: aminotransferase class I/II-fold pyridoxal phosphate-dependent enzyme [Bacteroidetes bacterium]|nr:MAG: aminotransferase class I/II-fold pyridoxal phosphate-dependent enzyme [Bacteroidota bacterium]